MTKTEYEKINNLLENKEKYENILDDLDDINIFKYITVKINNGSNKVDWDYELNEEEIHHFKEYFKNLLNKTEQELMELGYYD